MRSYVHAGLTVLLGLVFLYSAYGKITGIDFFELDLVSMGLAGWSWAGSAARLLIGIELFIALLLFLNIRLRSFTLPFVAILLLLFTAFLAFRLITGAGADNCHCFGPRINMPTSLSIGKNVLLVGLTAYLWKAHPGTEWPRPWVIIGIALTFSVAVPFIIPSTSDPKDTGPIGLDPEGPRIDFRRPLFTGFECDKGKYIFAFLSASCPGCVLAGYKLGVMKEKDPSLPVAFILNGKLDDIRRFRELTLARKVPHAILLQPDFGKWVGNELPAIFLVEEGRIVDRLGYDRLNPETVRKWLQKP